MALTVILKMEIIVRLKLNLISRLEL